ncbi:RNA-guided endonuclease TnpB family protein [Arachidicoccus terrestris]|uniref:RNA-guided endonuclease TnpB family protein n=1 Tax=Arachidicoccus terrestris TaxID=2875539 RepID=UPI001CC6FA2B|nr:RNA-guided endonuclease TnpB family protein [Arachidicoccus terrestris]UAY53885.1 transposase [Arachidicoccus terrestris]
MKSTHLKAYKFRIYPEGEQINFLARQFGCVRFVYNYALELRQKTYEETGKSLSYYDTAKMLPVLKSRQETGWLGEVIAQPLQMAMQNVDDSYRRFFKGQNRYPRFRCRSDRQCFKLPQGFRVEGDHLWLPKLKTGIRIKISRQIKGKILYLHLSRTTTGNYYVSFTCEVPREILAGTGKDTSVDVGIKDAAILSDGTRYENIKPLKTLEKKLKHRQRQLSKKQKGSKSRKRQRHIVARLHERIKNLREDHLHKITTDIVKNHDTVAVEDLTVKNMLKNHCLAKSLSDASLGKLLTQLEYKCDWYGRKFVKVDRFFPSSKTCHVCGEKKEDLTLADRAWACSCCHTMHDRDVNAARNILREGLKILSGCGAQSDTKQKQAEASPPGESVKPEAKAKQKEKPDA